MIAAERTALPLASEIEALVADIPGWSPLDELFSLSLLAHSTADLPGDIVELGSWCGRSSVVLAAAARDTHGLVHCIDLFPTRNDWLRNADGSFSFAVDIAGRRCGAYEETTLWAEPYHTQVAPLFEEYPQMLDRFLATVKSRDLEQMVRAHRGTSATFAAATAASFQCRLLFIDADHGYEAVKADILNLSPYLVPSGWICFDDAFSSYEGVDRAITELVIDNPDYDIKRQLTRKCFAARRSARKATS